MGWSDYYHGSNCHTASVNGAYFVRDYASAGYWAIAEAPDSKGVTALHTETLGSSTRPIGYSPRSSVFSS